MQSESHSPDQREIELHAAAEFERRCDRPSEVIAVAPGRVNLIGEHTDHQDGWALPAAIDRFAVVAAARRRDDLIVPHSLRFGSATPFRAHRALTPSDDWADLLRGVIREAALDGHATPGLDLLVAGNLSPGVGMSSSAAVGVAVAHIVLGLALGRGLGLGGGLGRGADEGDCRRPIPGEAWRSRCADLAHRAETRFLGVPCGIMDSFASAHARAGCALFLDCRHPEIAPIPVSSSLGAWFVVESGIARSLRAGDYGTRVEQCRDAVRGLADPAAEGADGESDVIRDLGEVTTETLDRRLTPLLARRVRHVLTENRRVHEMVAALSRFADLPQGSARARVQAAGIGEILDESHRSLRDDFEVSIPAVDTLVEIGRREGAIGSRMMGAGFGGSTIHLVAHEIVAGWAERVAKKYHDATGAQATVHQVTLTGGLCDSAPHP